MAKHSDDSSHSFAVCPVCRCWVPANKIHYDRDDDDRVISICDYCMGEPIPEGRKFVHEPHWGETQCIYCDSWDTKWLPPYDKNKYRCNDCGEEFYK